MIEIVSIVLISLFILISIIMVFRGPTIWDRLMGFNLCSTKMIVVILMVALMSGKTFLLDAAIIYALVGFVSTIFIARLSSNRGGAYKARENLNWSLSKKNDQEDKL